jgi:tRNA-splicing ligase RtcB
MLIHYVIKKTLNHLHMPVQTIISNTNVPIKIWTDKIEPMAITQLKNTANLPFVFKHVAVMPDVHYGIGATVGSVIATKGAICPAAVGVDIGCGMMAVKTNLDHEIVLDKISQIRKAIEESIPVGFNQNKIAAESVKQWDGWLRSEKLSYVDQVLKDKSLLQLGTLGGGNHFIEICLDTEDNVWAMLHSGSRNIGKVLAERHIQSAKDILKKMFIELPDPDLAYFSEKSQEFQNYLSDVKWCQEYAMQNRREMMKKVLKNLSLIIFNDEREVEKLMEVNCHHNYVSNEHHFGEDVLVTRKGAVSANKDEYGIIPGSMGAKSFIVKGKGNADSFHSCSHGAGRRMSRNQARKEFTIDDLIRQTSGVECRKDDGVLDEIPEAYKNIDEVMNNQSDLVEIVAQLKQIMCVKG